MNISAIVMASGLSKRMNKSKLHMEINNKKIFEFILETIKLCQCFNEVIVVANDLEIIQKSESLEFKTVKNEKSYLGQSTSINLGLINSKYSQGYMFFVADQPFINESTIKALIDEFNKNPDKIVIPCYNGKSGNPVIFPHNLKEELLNLEGDIGGRAVINNHINKVIKVHIQTDYENIDIDTMEDYEKVLKMKVI